MKDNKYWKNYVHDIDADEIEKNIKKTTFKSRGMDLNLTYFEKNKNGPNILCIPGISCYGLFYAELLYNMYLSGYNVFVLDFQGHGDSAGARGDFTINEILQNVKDAVKYISNNFNNKIGVFGGSFGGFIAFYLALSDEPKISSVVCHNPAILTEKKFHDEVIKKVKFFLPALKMLVKIFPKLKIPTSIYVDDEAFFETEREKKDADKFKKDPDAVMRYTLRGVMSQITTAPPGPIDKIKVPTMFLAPERDSLMSLAYVEDLYDRLSPIRKKMVKLDGGHLFLHSHPFDAAKIICGWFDETL